MNTQATTVHNRKVDTLVRKSVYDVSFFGLCDLHCTAGVQRTRQAGGCTVYSVQCAQTGEWLVVNTGPSARTHVTKSDIFDIVRH